MRCLVVYSSVTGNTRTVAEAVAAAMPPGTPLASVHRAPPPDGYDFIALGFWVKRGMPDPRMVRYMRQVRGTPVGWFGTLAAWPDSPHARQVEMAAQRLLEGNRILGGFLCQGRLAPKRFAAAMDPMLASATHPMTEERRARLLEAAKHPDAADCARAHAVFQEFLGTVSTWGTG